MPSTQHSILLPLLVLIPLLCGFGVALLPKGKNAVVKGFALLSTLVVFAASVCLCLRFDWSGSAPGTPQFFYNAPWFTDFGVNFRFGVDSISLWLVMLTTFLMPVTVLGSFSAVTNRAKEFYLWLLVLQAAMTGVFLAQDLILFYCCFELTLVPLYFLIGIFGSGNRQWASKKFFIFTLTGSLLTFAGVMWIAWKQATVTDTWSFDIPTLTTFASTQLSRVQQAWVLGALMAGFAVKVPLFPVHTWLPLAHTEAPTAGSVILAGVLLKLGTYGLLRFVIPMVPGAAVTYAPVIAVFAIIGILYTALICWVQDDVKKLVAYSSVSHLGFCVLGMFALNTIGIGGSVLYMINHGLSTGALFLCIGMIYERYHTRDMNELGGLGKRLPVWSTFMVFFCLASVGLPGLNGFVGEFLTLLGAFTSATLGWQYTAVAAVGLILGAIYILYMLGRVVMGPVKEPEHYAGKVSDLTTREIAVLTPLAVACIVLGVYPTPVLQSLEPAIHNITAGTTLVLADRSSDLKIHHGDHGEHGEELSMGHSTCFSPLRELSVLRGESPATATEVAR
ncbi:MAG: NADH-quinone oxidoreductase subunit M [Phycisphaeraceae bacterium]